MKYLVTIEGQEHEVDVAIAPDGRVAVSLDGEARPELDAVRVPGGVSLRIHDRVYDIATGGTAAGTQITAGEARGVAGLGSARLRARGKGKSSVSAAGRDIRAPMPGRVVKILVEKDQEVEADTPCVVIEAMKMENELRAPRTGTVAEILVAEGVSVQCEELLVRFE